MAGRVSKAAEAQGRTKEGREKARLEKLLRDVDLTLGLAGSSAEVKEALKRILAQIDGEGEGTL